jgi:hypothetical protein
MTVCVCVCVCRCVGACASVGACVFSLRRSSAAVTPPSARAARGTPACGAPPPAASTRRVSHAPLAQRVRQRKNSAGPLPSTDGARAAAAPLLGGHGERGARQQPRSAQLPARSEHATRRRRWRDDGCCMLTALRRRRCADGVAQTALRTGGIAAAVMSSTGGATGACDVMRGRGWCHKCVALGCHGPAQTPVNGRATRMRVRPTTAAPLRLPAGGWGSSMEAMAALRGVSCAPVPTQAHRRTRSGGGNHVRCAALGTPRRPSARTAALTHAPPPLVTLGCAA